MADPAPLFIFGVARSGTNLLARMLDAHPRIGVALDPLMPLFKVWRNLAIAHTAPTALSASFDPTSPFQDYYFAASGPAMLELMLAAPCDISVPQAERAALRASVAERAALESPGLAQRFSNWDGASIADLFASALAILAEDGAERGKRDPAWIGAKEVWTAEFALPLARAFPRARFLLIHRDPRAVIASLAALMARDESQAAHTISYMRHWRKHVALANRFASMPEFAGRLLALRFEDLAVDPQAGARRVTDFLELTFDADMLNPGGGGWAGNSSFGPNRAPIESANRDRWRGTLAATMVATVDFHCGPEMTLIGYESAARSDAPDAAVVAEVMAADQTPGKWRSDSGDAATDLAWDVMRHRMLAAPDQLWPRDMVRRGFLFAELYSALTGR